MVVTGGMDAASFIPSNQNLLMLCNFWEKNARRHLGKTIAGAAFLSLLCSVELASGTTYNSNGSSADVQAKVNLCSAGDTVTLPSGAFSWTQGVSWNAPAGVTLQGAGTSATGGGDQTVIIDNYASGSPLLTLNASSSGTLRMTGITVQSGSGSTKDGGTIKINGPGNVRIDHCHLNATSTANYKTVVFNSGVFGVMDHCILDFTGTNALYFYNGRLRRGGLDGEPRMVAPNDFWQRRLFLTSRTTSSTGMWAAAHTALGFSMDALRPRWSCDSTLSTQSCLGETHATGHAPDDRGVRSQEVYGNSVTSSLAHDPNY